MQLIKYFLFFLILVSQPAFALSIKHVSHFPAQLDFINSKNITVKFSIDEPANVNLNIYDDRDLLVRRISSNGQLSKGEHSFIWNGYDQIGRQLPPEAYRYTIVAKKGAITVEHDLTDLTGAQVVKVHQLKWDKEKNKVQFRILKPSRVNIRVGLKKGGPLLATVLNWVSRGHGFHEVNWDGLDISDVIDVSQSDQFEISAQAFTLSANTILIGPPSEDIKLIDVQWDEEKRIRKKTQTKRMKMHSQQYIEKSGDFTLKVELPTSLQKTSSGLPIVSKKIPVRFNVPKVVQQRMLNDRFEPILFVDGIYEQENEVGFFPMTWNWDPKKYDNGEHVLTINLRGYDGHLGSASVKVFLQH